MIDAPYSRHLHGRRPAVMTSSAEKVTMSARVVTVCDEPRWRKRSFEMGDAGSGKDHLAGRALAVQVMVHISESPCRRVMSGSGSATRRGSCGPLLVVTAGA